MPKETSKIKIQQSSLVNQIAGRVASGGSGPRLAALS
jgi:hypothetical protein